ncbi:MULTISPECIES: MotA/TolQ/ExbB proton channel family protein [Roseomonadaceae]|uniref:MotA/TolQ/ExbB proton channel family protein n=1 Tax=Falsiroseomonas oleicola TaxID=2801474 RepID=A0ABS6H289_9PROT|nr:MotA/TolQ/ExbB proton channel family protein [Roseomonas oleicola]MBU8542534.1 MotA/TolQ/ExbB proton channel family protein [Roseomonas oleicola]
METAHDLSPLGLFLAADWVVRSVMLMLVLASIGVWAMALDRALRFRRLAQDARALRRFAEDGSPPAHDNAWAEVLVAAEQAAREVMGESPADRRHYIASAARLAVTERTARAKAGLPVLASIASTAPFIGLFGTVWGIMNAFTAIARSGNTSLSAVAPGIAEALFATALGLVAAIPAALAYNRLSAMLGEARGAATGAGERLARRLGLAGASRTRLAAE